MTGSRTKMEILDNLLISIDTLSDSGGFKDLESRGVPDYYLVKSILSNLQEYAEEQVNQSGIEALDEAMRAQRIRTKLTIEEYQLNVTKWGTVLLKISAAISGKDMVLVDSFRKLIELAGPESLKETSLRKRNKDETKKSIDKIFPEKLKTTERSKEEVEEEAERSEKFMRSLMYVSMYIFSEQKDEQRLAEDITVVKKTIENMRSKNNSLVVDALENHVKGLAPSQRVAWCERVLEMLDNTVLIDALSGRDIKLLKTVFSEAEKKYRADMPVSMKKVKITPPVEEPKQVDTKKPKKTDQKSEVNTPVLSDIEIYIKKTVQWHESTPREKDDDFFKQNILQYQTEHNLSNEELITLMKRWESENDEAIVYVNTKIGSLAPKEIQGIEGQALLHRKAVFESSRRDVEGFKNFNRKGVVDFRKIEEIPGYGYSVNDGISNWTSDKNIQKSLYNFKEIMHFTYSDMLRQVKQWRSEVEGQRNYGAELYAPESYDPSGIYSGMEPGRRALLEGFDTFLEETNKIVSAKPDGKVGLFEALDKFDWTEDISILILNGVKEAGENNLTILQGSLQIYQAKHQLTTAELLQKTKQWVNILKRNYPEENECQTLYKNLEKISNNLKKMDQKAKPEQPSAIVENRINLCEKTMEAFKAEMIKAIAISETKQVKSNGKMIEERELKPAHEMFETSNAVKHPLYQSDPKFKAHVDSYQALTKVHAALTMPDKSAEQLLEESDSVLHSQKEVLTKYSSRGQSSTVVNLLLSVLSAFGAVGNALAQKIKPTIGQQFFTAAKQQQQPVKSIDSQKPKKTG